MRGDAVFNSDNNPKVILLKKNESIIIKKSKNIIFYSDTEPEKYGYKVKKVYKHDHRAYTQGLFYQDGFLYEATGLTGESSVRKVDLETGDVIQSFSMSKDIFGEGITYFDNKIVQISWRAGRGFVYNFEDFKLITEFSIPAASTAMTAFIAKVLVDVSPSNQGAPYAKPYLLDTDGMLTTKGIGHFESRPWVFLDYQPTGVEAEYPLENPLAFWAASLSSRTAYEARLAPMPAEIRLRYWEVDHSIYGAAACAVETARGWVGYSGDLRFHGRFAQTSQRFVEELAALRPEVLICEGTRLTTPNKTSEGEVFEHCLQAAQSGRGKLIVADFAPRNVERLQIFLEIAHREQRRLLLQPRDAYLLRAMYLANPTRMDDTMDDEHIAVYADPKSNRYTWEQIVLEHYADKIISPREVSKHPDENILAFSLTDVADLLDLQAIKGAPIEGVYIFSNSRAYDDEQKVDFERLWNWLTYFGLRVYGLKKPYRTKEGLLIAETEPGYHASGHAGKDELVRMVKEINPRVLIPVHTERPDLWRDLLHGTDIKIMEPQAGMPILL